MAENKNGITTRSEAQAERAAFTQRRILDAAEGVFALRGLNGTRVREIADAAGVNGATLYNYYPSKDALYEAVLERGVRPLTEYIGGFSAGASEEESARNLVRAVMQHLAARPHLSKLIYLEAISEGDFLPKLARRWFKPILDQIVGQLKERPAPGHLDESMYPSVAALFIQMSFGHFALAPLMKETTDEDPLSEEGIAKQTRMIEVLIDQLFPQPAKAANES